MRAARGVTGRALLLPAVAAALPLLFFAAPAAAGNRHSYAIGGRSAMMAGAFTAVADDASASWYNPGGLGFHRRSSFEISANAFNLSYLKIDDLLAVKTEAEELGEDFSSIDLFVIPTSFVYVLSLTPGDAAHPVNFAFSVFVPEAQRFGDTMNIELEQEYPDQGLDLEVAERLDFNVDTQQYLIGPSLGFNVNEYLGVGLSIYGLYATGSFDADYYFHVLERNAQTESFAVGTYKFDATHVGIGFTTGMLVRIRDIFNIGLHFRSPTFKIYSDAKVTVLEGVAFEEAAFEDSSKSFRGFAAQMIYPWSLTLAFALYRQGRWVVDLELDYMHPLKNASTNINYKWVMNGRVGAEVALTRKFILGFGVFTDLNPERELKEFHDRKLNFLGGSVGLTWRKAYDISGSTKTDRIGFTTTIGVRYAHGWGKVLGLQQDTTVDDERVGERLRAVKSTVDEVGIYLGSSMSF